MLGLRHASVGTSALNAIRSSSRLILPTRQRLADPHVLLLNDRAARIGHRSHRAPRGNKKGAPRVSLIKHGDFDGARIGESTVSCTKDASLDVQLLLSGVLKPCIKK